MRLYRRSHTDSVTQRTGGCDEGRESQQIELCPRFPRDCAPGSPLFWANLGSPGITKPDLGSPSNCITEFA
jgi:hypothetical protein